MAGEAYWRLKQLRPPDGRQGRELWEETAKRDLPVDIQMSDERSSPYGMGSLEGPDIAASSKRDVVTPQTACCQTSALYYRTAAECCAGSGVVQPLQAVPSARAASLCDGQLLPIPEAMKLGARSFPSP
jgi:hypothetical protein